MTDNYVQKSVSLYRDAKNNLYWLFPNNTIERGFYILGLPAKKFDAASTDCMTLIHETLDLMQYCRSVTYGDATQDLKARFKAEVKLWSGSPGLQKASSAVLTIYLTDNEFCIDVFSAKKEERGAYKYTIKRPLEASRDEFAEALKEAFDFYK